jgi:hypothetical protein
MTHFHPMLFSTAMVQALLREIERPGSGKTQTRRIVTPHNSLFDGEPWRRNTKAQTWDWAKAWVEGGPSPAGNPGPYLKLPWLSGDEDPWEGSVHRIYPRIQPGDRIWVREKFALVGGWDPGFLLCAADWREEARKLRLENAGRAPRWTPAIHMRRAHSRLTLLVEDVRIERVQEISKPDAMAEGIVKISKDGGRVWKFGIPDRDGWPGTDDAGWPRPDWRTTPTAAYAALWRSINGAASWDANPWVWVIGFRPVLNIDIAP